MVYQTVKCRYCESEHLIKSGTQNGHQRLKCKSCNRSFQMTYTYEANKPGVTEKIEPMAHNSNGVRDTARLLNISKNTVVAHLKKSESSKICQ